MKKLLTICASAAIALCAGAQDKEDSISYMPHFHDPVSSRLRNARFSIDGSITKEISYFINTDLCDRGKMKILDAWAKMEFVPNLSLQAGQFRMPFGVDPFRAPHQYYFANRSFIGKQMCNYRAVGAMLIYNFSKLPLKLEAGAFNPYTIGDHAVWEKAIAAAGKATLSAGNMKFSAGASSIRPSGKRANLLGASASWSHARWIVEGEYMHKHYVKMPVKAGIFNRLSFQGRFDGITDHSDAIPDENNCLTLTDPARNRVTVGGTLTTMKAKNMYFDFRVDYEKNFYLHNVKASPEYADKIVAEMVLRF